MSSNLRKWKSRARVWFALLLAAAPSLAAEPSAQRPESVLKLTDLSGRTVAPFATSTNQFHVFIFVSNDCPISNRYAPEIRRLHDSFRNHRVAFWLIHPLKDESLASIQRHTKEYQLPGTVLADRTGDFTRFAGVRVTPEAVLYNQQQELLYRGRIDNRFPRLGQSRVEPTEFDLRHAIEAVLAHHPVATPRTQAVGCALPERP